MTRLLRVCIGAMTLPALLALSASAARNKGIEVDFKTSQGQDAGTAILTPEGNRVKVYFTQDMLLPAYTNHTIPQTF